MFKEEVWTVIEKRKYARVDVEFELSCRPAEQRDRVPCQGRAVNACPGGLYFETRRCQCACGKIVELELRIPPGDGRLGRPGRISAYGKLLRTEKVGTSAETKNASDEYYGVAIQFWRAPKLAT